MNNRSMPAVNSAPATEKRRDGGSKQWTNLTIVMAASCLLCACVNILSAHYFGKNDLLLTSGKGAHGGNIAINEYSSSFAATLHKSVEKIAAKSSITDRRTTQKDSAPHLHQNELNQLDLLSDAHRSNIVEEEEDGQEEEEEEGDDQPSDNDDDGSDQDTKKDGQYVELDENGLAVIRGDNSVADYSNKDDDVRDKVILDTATDLDTSNTDAKSDISDDLKRQIQAELSSTPLERLATLNCERFGGPSRQAAAQEMVYWQDIPSDSTYTSPFYRNVQHASSNKDNTRQYMTFEPDGGGWNNIRMAMETVLGLGIAMGRTIVLPPQQRMYLLAKGRGKQRTDFGFEDFFPMDELNKDNAGLNMITTKEYLELEAMTGNMYDKYTGKVSFPPDNRTDWDGQDVKLLKEWLRNVSLTPLWSPSGCLAAFPASGNHKDVQMLNSTITQIHKNGVLHDLHIDNPKPVDAGPSERMWENLARRNALCVYDEEMQNTRRVHFMCYHKLRVRMLVHFYAFMFFEDWREDLWMKRFMRDHVRYIDEIQCAAARVVESMRKEARKNGDADGEFDTFHVRRGDFQFKKTRIEASEIYTNVKDKLKKGATVFVATDEKDKKFFNTLKEYYNVKFLDDFGEELANINTNHYGMIDQLVASRGRNFFGCYHSTFTGFIMRIRGYHSTNYKLPGYEQGLLPTSFYYTPVSQMDTMLKYAPVQTPFFNREFPVSWRDLDFGIGRLPRNNNNIVMAVK